MRRQIWTVAALGGILLAGCALLGNHRSAWAAGVNSPRVELLPSDAHGNPIAGQSYYHIKARPGKTVHEYAKVGNTGTRAGLVSLVPVDAESALYGGVSYRLPGQQRRQVGGWTKMQRTKVWLRPGRSVVVPFTVHLPKGLKPGQYVGGLTAFVPSPRPKGAKFAVLTVQLRVVSAIVIQVPGPIRTSLGISSVSVKYQPTGVFAGVHIRNTGGRLLTGHGALIVRKVGDSSAIIHKHFFVDTTVPHTSITYPIPWKPKPSYGVYDARATLTWKGGHTSWNHTFRVGPPPPPPRPAQPGGHPVKKTFPMGMSVGAIVGIAVLVLGAIMFGVILWRRRAASKVRPRSLGRDPMGRESSVPFSSR